MKGQFHIQRRINCPNPDWKLFSWEWVVQFLIWYVVLYSEELPLISDPLAWICRTGFQYVLNPIHLRVLLFNIMNINKSDNIKLLPYHYMRIALAACWGFSTNMCAKWVDLWLGDSSNILRYHYLCQIFSAIKSNAFWFVQVRAISLVTKLSLFVH